MVWGWVSEEWPLCTKGESCLFKGGSAAEVSAFSGDTKPTNLTLLDLTRLHLEVVYLMPGSKTTAVLSHTHVAETGGGGPGTHPHTHPGTETSLNLASFTKG